MAYYSELGGFEFHDKAVVGDYTYYVFESKDARRLIRRIHNTTDSNRFCLTLDSIAAILSNPASYEYRSISGWKF
jgi:hypothetical protein